MKLRSTPEEEQAFGAKIGKALIIVLLLFGVYFVYAMTWGPIG